MARKTLFGAARRLLLGRGTRRPQPTRVLSLQEVRGPRLKLDDLLQCGHVGYTEFQGGYVERTGKLGIEGPVESEPQIAALRDCFVMQGYDATTVTLARLRDVFIGLPLGICVTSDGIIIDETAQVARGIEPSLASVPFISMADNTFAPSEYIDVREPILHCFHRATGAYGHFLFDVLPIIALCREAIRAGRCKVLLPEFPDWGIPALQALGVERSAIVSAPAAAIRCRDVLISDTLTTLNTFFPNPELCMAPARALGVDRTRWANVGSRIYLSRENQHNFFARGVENEQEVRAALRELGFTILEPANMAFHDQIRAINSASVIVGAHGSGFGNLIFARAGTLVVDLMPQDWVGFFGAVGTPERWLLNVTTAFDLDYMVLLCRSRVFQHLPETDTSGLQKRGIAATVDIDLLRRLIC